MLQDSPASLCMLALEFSTTAILYSYSENLQYHLRTKSSKMANPTCKRVLFCIATILVMSEFGVSMNAGSNDSSPQPQTTLPSATTLPPTTTKVTTTSMGTSTRAPTGTTANATMGTTTATTMVTEFDTTEIGTETGTTVITGTTRSGTTKSPPPGSWTINDDAGNVCMKIQFSGTFKIGEESMVIPRNGITKGSICTDNEAVFNLVNAEKDPSFNMTMVFKRVGKTYQMIRIYFSIIEVQEPLVNQYHGDHEKVYFEAPIGKYFTCRTDTQDVFHENVTMTLSEQKYQPFAKTSQGDYGDAFDCTDNLPEDHKPRVGLIVSMTLLALLVVAGCGYFVYRRRKSSYERFNNGI